MEAVFESIWQLANPYLNTRKNDIHTKISTELAFELLKREDGDSTIVIPAIILHDVGWKKVPEHLHLKAFGPKATSPELNRIHEKEGLKIAEESYPSHRRLQPARPPGHQVFLPACEVETPARALEGAVLCASMTSHDSPHARRNPLHHQPTLS